MVRLVRGPARGEARSKAGGLPDLDAEDLMEDRETRAEQIVELCGCSKESALMAADAVPAPADIEDAVDFVLSLMSCCHPRIPGADDPTAQHGVTDVRRPYAAAANGWELQPDSADASLYPMRELPPANGLRLADGALMLAHRAESPLPAQPPPPGLAADATTALLCIDFRLIAGAGDLPRSLYVRLNPDASMDEEIAVWMADAEGGETRQARAIVPLRKPSTGWMCPPDAETCVCRTSVTLALEPFEATGSAVPTISCQWVRSADLYGSLIFGQPQEDASPLES